MRHVVLLESQGPLSLEKKLRVELQTSTVTHWLTEIAFWRKSKANAESQRASLLVAWAHWWPEQHLCLRAHLKCVSIDPLRQNETGPRRLL